MTVVPSLAIVLTHPIQYLVPLWRKLAQNRAIRSRVFYASRHGVESRYDPGFGTAFAWDVPLLDGYAYTILDSTPVPGVAGPLANLYPRGLYSAFRGERFDAVLVHGYANVAAWGGAVAALRARIPLLMRGESHHHHEILGPRHSLKAAVLPTLLRQVDGLLPIGTWNRDYWLSYGVARDKMRMCYYAVDNELFAQRVAGDPSAIAELRAKWGATADHTVFMYCAKLLPVKAPEVLLRAFAALPQRKHAKLVMVGAGPLEEQLRSLAHTLGLGEVHWEGFVNQGRLPFYYAGADVLVLPSRFEPWGIVVNEAMACGTPCIVSDVVGAGPDLVAGPGAGLVFEHDNVSALRDALSCALDREARGVWRKNLEKALKVANLTQNVEAISELVTEITGRRHGATA